MQKKTVFLLAWILLSGTAFAVDQVTCLKATQQQMLSAPLNIWNIDSFKNFVEDGYPLQSYSVKSDDGYHLTMMRIQKRGTQITNGLPAVLLQHGFNGCSEAYVINGSKQGLAFILADKGFDVWLGNNRGSKYSRKHDFYDVSDPRFWKFSFQEMGRFDIPAFFKKIMDETGQKKITYFGHSQGSAQMFAALSDHESNHLVAPYLESFRALAPVVFLSNTDVWYFKVARWISNPLSFISQYAGFDYMQQGNWQFNQDTVKYYHDLCSKSQCSYNTDTERYPEVNNFVRYGYKKNSDPSGFSIQSMMHFVQQMKQNNLTQKFMKFDHGSHLNLVEYGTTTPPEYDLSLIKNKIFIYSGEGDKLATQADHEYLLKKLVNADVKYKPIAKYGHRTFIIGLDNSALYQPIADEILNDINFYTQ